MIVHWLIASRGAGLLRGSLDDSQHSTTRYKRKIQGYVPHCGAGLVIDRNIHTTQHR